LAAVSSLLGAKGKQVLLPNPPGLEFVANFFGCLYAGAVAVPACSSLLSPRKHDRLRFLVDDADADFILAASTKSLSSFRECIAGEEWASRMTLLATDEVSETEAADWSPSNCGPDDVAYIQYSSGSTSSPKGVVISHRNVMSNQRMLQQAFHTSADSVIVSWLPHFHDMGPRRRYPAGYLRRNVRSVDGAARIYTQTSAMAARHFDLSSSD
jgi:acyl-CoA synthetase (AMP-forming)/AMP-acid ligase II